MPSTHIAALRALLMDLDAWVTAGTAPPADRMPRIADATLVHVAEREGLRTILTIDHDNFETYRIGRNAKFRILPTRAR